MYLCRLIRLLMAFVPCGQRVLNHDQLLDWTRERGAAPFGADDRRSPQPVPPVVGTTSSRDQPRRRTARSYLASNFRASAGVAGASPSSSMILTAFSTNAALLGASRPLPR